MIKTLADNNQGQYHEHSDDYSTKEKPAEQIDHCLATRCIQKGHAIDAEQPFIPRKIVFINPEC